MITNPDVSEVDWDKAPIVLTDEEYTELRENVRCGTRRLCWHRWQRRRALRAEEVVVLGHVNGVAFPGGRYCPRCGSVRTDVDDSRTDGDRWKQEELTGRR